MKSLKQRETGILNERDRVQCGARFITVYAVKRYDLFVNIDHGASAGNIRPRLTGVGKIIDYEIQLLPRVHEWISVDNYIIMPNHIHILLRAVNSDWTSGEASEAARRAIIGLKRAVTLKAGFSPWRKSFHDHAISDSDEYWIMSNYIDADPACLYGDTAQ